MAEPETPEEELDRLSAELEALYEIADKFVQWFKIYGAYNVCVSAPFQRLRGAVGDLDE